jgi:Leucine-rich repeat (LRR) protein
VPRDAKLPLLEDVDLSFNRLTRLPQQFQQLAELAPFRFLDVSSNDICDVRL